MRLAFHKLYGRWTLALSAALCAVTLSPPPGLAQPATVQELEDENSRPDWGPRCLDFVSYVEAVCSDPRYTEDCPALREAVLSLETKTRRMSPESDHPHARDLEKACTWAMDSLTHIAPNPAATETPSSDTPTELALPKVFGGVAVPTTAPTPREDLVLGPKCRAFAAAVRSYCAPDGSSRPNQACRAFEDTLSLIRSSLRDDPGNQLDLQDAFEAACKDATASVQNLSTR